MRMTHQARKWCCFGLVVMVVALGCWGGVECLSSRLIPSVDKLIATLEDPLSTPSQRYYACKWLQHKSPERAAHAVPALAACVAGNAVDRTIPGTGGVSINDARAIAAETLGMLGQHAGPAVPVLLAHLDDGCSTVRYDIAWALGQIGDTSTVDTLLQRLLVEEDPDVAGVVRDSIIQLGGDPVAWLMDRLASPDPWTRRAALQAYGQARGRYQLAKLATFLEDESPMVRAEAATIIGRSHARSMTATLARRLVTEPDHAVRAAIREAIIAVYAWPEHPDSSTALHWAAGDGGLEVVRLLLQAGADVRALNAHKETPLHWAGSASVARVLVAHGASVAARDAYQRTPLHTAARAGRVDVVQLLLSSGARRDARNAKGRTARDDAELAWRKAPPGAPGDYETVIGMLGGPTGE